MRFTSLAVAGLLASSAAAQKNSSGTDLPKEDVVKRNLRHRAGIKYIKPGKDNPSTVQDGQCEIFQYKVKGRFDGDGELFFEWKVYDKDVRRGRKDRMPGGGVVHAKSKEDLDLAFKVCCMDNKIMGSGENTAEIYVITNEDGGGSCVDSPVVSVSCIRSTTPPSSFPSFGPSSSPSALPSSLPSVSPSASPSTAPSVTPSMSPSALPSTSPSVAPTLGRKSQAPTSAPTIDDESPPSEAPTSSRTIGGESPPSEAPTAPPSVAQTDAIGLLEPPKGAGCGGDPHIKRWENGRYDYHGECDLIMLENASFDNGLGMHIHVRTESRKFFSFVNAAALQIGDDVLEVEAYGVYHLNSINNAPLSESSLSGYAIGYTTPQEKEHHFTIDMGAKGQVLIKSFKEFLRVSIVDARGDDYRSSFGLMGTFSTGDMVARDGETIFEKTNEFGQEWQVLPTDPQLFHEMRAPQYPQQCILPEEDATESRRREAMTMALEEAQQACAQWHEKPDFEDCVFDVMHSGDLDYAGVAGDF